MHVLRGHSIALPNSPLMQATDYSVHRIERSPSSTMSSQVTSSDRYVSYAIHEMGDSSQDRLPALPMASDLPLYVKDEAICAKEDDLTELDATENLTSYSDEVLMQRLYRSVQHRDEHLDASSTDDDVDDAFEHTDRLTGQSNSADNNDEMYQRFDLATTPSSNDDSSTSSRQQADDIYLIPGYPGLWRPSADNENSQSPVNYDADDERRIITKTKVRTTHAPQLQSPLRHHVDETTTHVTGCDQLHRSAPFPSAGAHVLVDTSESDSFQTCPLSQSKQQNHLELNRIHHSDEYRPDSQDEKIFLIRERERGVSLPVTVKIDYDNMALRLSTSTPIDVQLHSTRESDLSSSSSSAAAIARSGPLILLKTSSSNRASSQSLSSHESEQGKQPSWLNTVNTVRTTSSPESSEGRKWIVCLDRAQTRSSIGLDAHTTLHKSARGPIRISQCNSHGDSITIENTSRSKNVDLANWTLRQSNDRGDLFTFTFPEHCLLQSNQSVKVMLGMRVYEAFHREWLLVDFGTSSSVRTTRRWPRGGTYIIMEHRTE